MNNWLSQNDFEFIYQRVPRLCVDLILLNSQNEILLTKRYAEPHLGKWHIPGGNIRFKESVRDAIHRLAKGELKIDVTEYSFAGVMEFPNEKRNGRDYHSISLGYFIKTNDKPFDGQWFYDLPDFTIPEHLKFLKEMFIVR